MPSSVSTTSYWNIRAAKKPTSRRLTRLVASSPESRRATVSLISTREPMSPPKRCEKNSIGRRSTCQKKRVDRAVASLVSIASSPRCCRQVSAPLTRAVTRHRRQHAAAATPSSPAPGCCRRRRARTRGRRARAAPAPASASTAKASAIRAPAGGSSAPAAADGGWPPGWNSGPFSKIRTTPVNDSSNSSVRHHARAVRRIVQVDPAAAEALDDDEVVEVPEDDERQRQVAELRRLLLVALAVQAVSRGRP